MMKYREYKNPEVVETRLYIEHPRKIGVYLPVHRRPMRVPGVDYAAAECLCFVTFNIHPRCGVRFIDSEGSLAWNAMWQQINTMGCKVHAACLMPDHVHLLAAPSGTGESISDIVRRIKTMIGTTLRRERDIYLKWQTSFYDHVLREYEKRADEYAAIVNYIYGNPVKAGLEDDYPFRYRVT